LSYFFVIFISFLCSLLGWAKPLLSASSSGQNQDVDTVLIDEEVLLPDGKFTRWHLQDILNGSRAGGYNQGE
jgi:hypothetical protein